MPCGTGKTLVGLWTAEGLGPRTLLAEPSLALVAQNFREWRANFKGTAPDVLVVCSDETVVRLNSDDVVVRPEDLQARVTSSPEEIAAFLRGSSRRKLLVTTLHSTPLVEQAMARRGVAAFDCAVIDEAHRTATREESAFATVLDADRIRSRGRLFLTATAKVIREGAGGREEVFSMNDEKSYGPRAHVLGFRTAVERGLLTDYQVVVPLIRESDLPGVVREIADPDVRATRAAEVCFLQAARDHKLTKVVTYHNSVARARRLAGEFEGVARALGFDREVWARAVDGTMAASTREGLLSVLRESPREVLTVLSNCRCLVEGVDVPALDGLVFFDPRGGEIDAVQAVCRVMRRAPGKTVGTIVLPVVVPDTVDVDAALSASSFRKVWQVVRALRSFDDGWEARCRLQIGGERGGGRGGGGLIETAGDQELVRLLGEKLEAKVVQVGLGIVGSPLSEDQIIGWIKSHQKRTGNPPTAASGPVLDEDENPTDTSWQAIDMALREGLRGLPGGSSVFKLVKQCGLGRDLAEETVTAWVKSHHERTGDAPTSESGAVLDGQGEHVGENWHALDVALRDGLRGLPGGSSVFTLVKQCGLARPPLSEERIGRWIRAHHQRTTSAPTVESGGVLDEQGEPVGENWGAINAALRKGLRGLPGGSSVFTLVKQCGLARPPLSEERIVGWIKSHHERTGKAPTLGSGTVLDEKGEPIGESWGAIDVALRDGFRGLPGGSSIAQLINQCGLGRQLTEEQITGWISAHHERTGKPPTAVSGPVLDEDEKPTGDSWQVVDDALRKGFRGLPGGSSVSKLVKQCGLGRDLAEETIVGWVRSHHERTGKAPTAESGAVLDTQGEPIGESWRAINMALRRGLRGLPGGSSLSTLIKTSGLKL
jgi:superfamily II DNA or RNA helicase